MKTTRVNLHVVNVPQRYGWWSDDAYAKNAHRPLSQHLVEVETDEGLTGLTELSWVTPPEPRPGRGEG